MPVPSGKHLARLSEFPAVDENGPGLAAENLASSLCPPCAITFFALTKSARVGNGVCLKVHLPAARGRFSVKSQSYPGLAF
jgi:hypothetical protein